MAEQLRKVCPGCKRRFRPASRNRSWCETCRPSRVKPGTVEAPVAVDEPGPIEVAVQRELEAAGRLETIEGASLLAVARDADTVDAARRAGVVEKLLRLKAVALAGVKRADDPVDAIRARREARMRAAG